MVLKVAVIGGGPSGLVTLKYLLEARKFFAGANIEAHLFEKAKDVGGIFSYRVYEDAEVSSFTTGLPSRPELMQLLSLSLRNI